MSNILTAEQIPLCGRHEARWTRAPAMRAFNLASAAVALVDARGRGCNGSDVGLEIAAIMLEWDL